MDQLRDETHGPGSIGETDGPPVAAVQMLGQQRFPVRIGARV